MRSLIIFLLFSFNLFASERPYYEVEVLESDGVQYFTFMAKPKAGGLVLGELPINEIGTEPTKMVMYFLGKDKDHQYTVSMLDNTVSFNWPRFSMSCQFHVSQSNEFYWLEKDYSCSPHIEVTLLNDDN